MLHVAPIAKDLVLLGGGHAHVTVLKRLAMAPVEGLRVTLVNRGSNTPYSGMLPGLIAGHYTFEETHIDLGRLARHCRARFICDEATGIDPEQKLLFFHSRPPLRYDLLSVDTGSAPDVSAIDGADRHVVPVKPISTFLERWEALCARAIARAEPLKIAVAGAGAGGVELLLAAQYRLQALRKSSGIEAPVSFHLFTSSSTILPAFSPQVRSIFDRLIQARGITVSCGAKVSRFTDRQIHLENGQVHAADEILLVTDASAPAWIKASGLACDDRGFISINDQLQSVSHDTIFAAGDIASSEHHPRPKAGVFAVRQGPPLARNLVRALTGKALLPFTPQRYFLSLISTGDRHAVAARHGMAVQGAWVWRWKDWIDRRFMAKFNDLKPMNADALPKPDARLSELDQLDDEAMRCGGCGAKVGADVLSQALQGLAPLQHADVIAGLAAPDDAAIIRARPGKVLVHTVDSFRALIDDPFIFGQIAANHALSDIFAMGAEPHTALAIATLPYASPEITGADLHQMMAGAITVLNEAGAALVGGHTAEGAELTLGFSINGSIDEARVLRKAGLRPGDKIILTKPLGTGALFAADMQARAKSRWIEAAVTAMLQSNGPAAKEILATGSDASTDITGFGLAGHLGELARASQVRIMIDTSALPVLAGTGEVMQAGIFSTLHEQNMRSARRFFDPAQEALLARHPVLFDPQTSGGLAAGVAADKAAACLANLHDLGFTSASIVGEVAPEKSGVWLTLV
jgi:selenide,water dikinase